MSKLASKLPTTFFLVTIAGCLGPTAQAQACSQPPTGLISWWPADGTPQDLVGGYDAQLSSGAGYVAGIVGQAFTLDGIDDVIQIPFDSPFDFSAGSPITIEAWIHPTSIDHGGPIVAKGQDNGSRNWWFGITGTGGQAGVAFFYSSVSGMIQQYETAGRPIQAGTWHYVAVSYVFGDASTIAIHIDGQVTSGSWTFGTGNVPPATNNFLPRIGGEEDPGANDRFVGHVDEVSIYEHSLSECQLRRIYLAGTAGKCKGDSDLDGVLDLDDNCPIASNSGQTDTDFDGAGDECDCAPGDPGLVAAPPEVDGLRLGGFGNQDRLDWCGITDDTGPATRYDICRGSTAGLPVGTESSEICLQNDHNSATIDDSAVPLDGEAFWYLVRGQNTCGTGTYGYTSDLSERMTSVCP